MSGSRGKGRRKPRAGSERKSRAKTQADEVYNERRRIKRQAAREMKIGNIAGANRLLELAHNTYAQVRERDRRRAIDKARLREISRDFEIYKYDRMDEVASSRKRLQDERERIFRGAKRAQKKTEGAESEPEFWRENVPRKLSKDEEALLFRVMAPLWRSSWDKREQVIKDVTGLASIEEVWAKYVVQEVQEMGLDISTMSAEEIYQRIVGKYGTVKR